MWKYRIYYSDWIWVSGNDTINERGEYGEQGIPNQYNRPGARARAVAWYDSYAQELWLFGGDGFASSTTQGKQSNLHAKCFLKIFTTLTKM